MSLKKFLISPETGNARSGQSLFEYIVLFAAVTGITVAVFSSFVTNLKTGGENYYSKAVVGIIGGE